MRILALRIFQNVLKEYKLMGRVIIVPITASGVLDLAVYRAKEVSTLCARLNVLLVTLLVMKPIAVSQFVLKAV